MRTFTKVLIKSYYSLKSNCDEYGGYWNFEVEKTHIDASNYQLHSSREFALKDENAYQ